MVFCCPVHDVRFDSMQNHKLPTLKGHSECPLAIGGVCYFPGQEPKSAPAATASAAPSGWGVKRTIAS